jgi:hypothetical protein
MSDMPMVSGSWAVEFDSVTLSTRRWANKREPIASIPAVYNEISPSARGLCHQPLK